MSSFLTVLFLAVVTLISSASIGSLPRDVNLNNFLGEYSGSEIPPIKQENADVGLNVLELVRKYRYPIEEHQNVETEDGYLLDIHRIPHGKTNESSPDKPVVLFIHCILCSSAEWVYMGPTKSLGYIMADLGYDVWMGNSRGNTWSRKHVRLDPNDKGNPEFWDFSFHEMGMYDLPAMIDYVLKVTGQEKLFLIGHSQGTTEVFVMLSERPEYNDKVRLFTALAPIAYISNTQNNYLQILAHSMSVLKPLGNILRLFEMLPFSKILPGIAEALCHDNSPVQFVCVEFLFAIVGANPKQLNNSMIPVIASNTPAGASLKQLDHYAQEIVSGRFRQFDYGVLGNLKRYSALVPPDYNIYNIKAPIAMYYGRGDLMADVTDVEKLHSQLTSVFLFSEVNDPNWSHLDFLWGIDAPTLLYKDVISMIHQY